MRIWVSRLAALVFLLGISRPCNAGLVDAIYSLGGPSVSGSVVNFDVSVDFKSNPGTNLEMVFFGIDVAPSSDALTGAGSDFSAFSFKLNSLLLTDWNLVEDFGGIVSPSTVQYDTLLQPLPNGTYLLGTLSVDLAVAGASLDPNLIVSIEGLGSMVGAQDPSDPSTFDFYPATFNPGHQPLVSGVVPEPAAWVSLTVGIGCVGLSRPRRQRANRRALKDRQ